MPPKPIVILHGWSDVSTSFRSLKTHIQKRLGRPMESIFLADWVSLDDDVTYADLADGMERAWSEHPALKRTARSADCIVHSTGGLVVREWMIRHYPDRLPPIHRLVMLAPANFGSPLAHHGKSVVGRARNGYKKLRGGSADRAFETGTHILDGLELGSGYSFDLAERDLFGAAGEKFGKDGVLTTVLIGNEGNKGPLGILEFDGSDGVVRTSCASLRCRRLTAFFEALPRDPRAPIEAELEPCTAHTAFRVVNRLDHGDVTLNKWARKGSKDRDEQERALDLICDSLEVTPAKFAGHVDRLDDETAELQEALDTASEDQEGFFDLFVEPDDEKHGHHSFILQMRDTQGQGLKDWLLEYYDTDEVNWNTGRIKASKSLTKLFNRRVIDDVHTWSRDPSHRAFHLDVTEIENLIEDGEGRRISISVTAEPALSTSDRGRGNRAGYYSYNDEDIGALKLGLAELPGYFPMHASTIARFEIERCQAPEIFEIRA